MREKNTISKAMREVRNDYEMGKTSRFVRQRALSNSGGVHADRLLGSMGDYLKRVEIARDIDINDSIVGQATTRLVANVMKTGFKIDPNTGDKGLDKALKDGWMDWSQDKDQCDIQGQQDFDSMSRMAFRSVIVDGDILGNPVENNTLQMLESHRLRESTRSQRDDIVFGVEIDSNRHRKAYWITKEDVGPYATTRWDDMQRIPAYTPAGDANMFHAYLPRRLSLTRGVTAYAPIATTATQVDDSNFAMLVKMQLSNCIVMMRERQIGIKTPGSKTEKGAPENEIDDSGWMKTFERMFPGIDMTGSPGETMKAWAPNLHTDQYVDYVRLMLTIIAVNLDLPLIVMLLEANETNFSGWRGAIDQARIRWREMQTEFSKRWHSPIYMWRVRAMMERDPVMRNAASRRKSTRMFDHTWQFPGWDYIEPNKDAQADIVQLNGGLVPMRYIQNRRGRDWPTVSENIVADKGLHIENAVAEYNRLIKSNPVLAEDEAFTWRELMFWLAPENVSAQYAALADDDSTLGQDNPNTGGNSPAQSRGSDG